MIILLFSQVSFVSYQRLGGRAEIVAIRWVACAVMLDIEFCDLAFQALV